MSLLSGPSRFVNVFVVFIGISASLSPSQAQQCPDRPFPQTEHLTCAPDDLFCADGVLDPEILSVLDLNGNGIRDIEEGRRAVALIQLDNIGDGTFRPQEDGFRDAGLRDPNVPLEPGCTSDACQEVGEGGPSIRSPLNTGHLVVVYIPDSDGIIDANDREATDDSVLYVGFDIFNGCPFPPNNVLGDVTDPMPDGFSSYRIDIHNIVEPLVSSLCNDGVPDFNADGVPELFGVPFDVDGNGEPVNTDSDQHDQRFPEGCPPQFAAVETALEIYRLVLFSGVASGELFPPLGKCVTEMAVEAAPNQSIRKATDRSSFEFCSKALGVAIPAGWIDTFPMEGPAGATQALIDLPRDVEFVVRHVDSIVDMRFPDTDFSQNRLRLGCGGVRSFSDSQGDSAGEDAITAIWSLQFAELEATKQIRCEGEDDQAWRETVEVLPGTTVEFKIEVENTGNVPLFVTLDDVLESLCMDGLEVVPVGCESGAPAPGPTSLLVTLNSPSRGIVDRPITFANSVAQPANPNACENPIDAFNCNNFSPGFFLPFDDKFLCDARSGLQSPMALLNGVDICTDPDNPVLGDTVTIQFKAILREPVDADFCESCGREVVDARNAITAIGDPELPDDVSNPPPPSEGAVFDVAGVIDTPRETALGHDNNVVTADVLCRDVTLDKTIGLVGGPYSDRYNIPGSAVFPYTVEYRYEVTNNGEVPELLKLTDEFLCADIAAVAGVSAVAGQCDLCLLAPVGMIIDPNQLDPNDSRAYHCQIRFDSEEALENFLMRDNERESCRTDTGDPDDCYRNCASVEATPVTVRPDERDICGAGTIGDDDEADLCYVACELKVCKQVRCLEDCTTTGLGPNDGWIDERVCSVSRECCNDVTDCPLPGETCAPPANRPLEVPVGACLEYRIIVRNASESLPLCALNIEDEMPAVVRDNFVAGPNRCSGNNAPCTSSAQCPSGQTCNTSVHVSGADCPGLQAGFNWDGVETCCQLSTPPEPDNPNTPESDGGVLTITWRADLLTTADPSESPNNTVRVSGSTDCDVCSGDLETPCTIDGDCPAGQTCLNECNELIYACMDEDDEAVDIVECAFTVDKDVTCDDPRQISPPPVYAPEDIPPDPPYEEIVQALPGSEVGFRMEICNTGEVDLTKITIDDEISCPGWVLPFAQGGPMVQATIGTTDVTPCICNLGAGGICETLDEMDGMKDLAACDPPGTATSARIPPNECLVITFEVRVPPDFGQDMAEMGTAVDCVNEFTASVETNVPCQGMTNPCAGEKSEVARINVRVPKLECDKQACVDMANNAGQPIPDGDCDNAGDVPFELDDQLYVPADDATFPLRVIYKFSLSNSLSGSPGEVDYAASKICDADLADDIRTNLLNAGFSVGPCALNIDPGGDGCANLGTLGNGDPGDPPSMRMVTCELRFATREAWNEFASKDRGGAPDFCYENEAAGSGTIDTTGLCARGAETTVNTGPCPQEVCIEPRCDLSVVKQARCLPNCSAVGMDPEEGWTNQCSVSHTPCTINSDCPGAESCNELDLAPGACVQYRIKLTNESLKQVDLCALKFDDEMTPPRNLPGGGPNPDYPWQSGPTNIATNCPCVGSSFSSVFNWDGNEVNCRLQNLLPPGEMCTITFQGQLKNENGVAEDDPTNTITVMGAGEPSGCDEDTPVFLCEATDSLPLDIKRCDFSVEKDVSCDMVTWEPEIVEALPGSMAWFRFRVINEPTSEVTLTSLDITDTLTCSSWYDNEFSCSIGGTDVTSCICPGGGCSLAQLNSGPKDLTGCRPANEPDGIAPGETLECKFKVEVPLEFMTMDTPVDCTNTVEIEPFPDACHTTGKSPCGSDDDDAAINVLVPKIECKKELCIDGDPDGTCDTDYAMSQSVQDVPVPYQVKYRWTLSNVGETDLKDVVLADTDFCNDAEANGLIVNGECDICAGGVVVDIPRGGVVQEFCALEFDDEDDCEEFAAKDNSTSESINEYVNMSSVSGAPDVAADVCPSTIMVRDECSAVLRCGAPTCCPEPPPREACGPHTKAKFEIWNEFESKFSGTERCIAQWDQLLLSEYTTPGVPNYFWRSVLRTDKGKARINGESSPFVCGADTQDVPLLGVSQKLLLFDGTYDEGEIDRSGMALVGTGSQSGRFLWEIGDGVPPDEARDSDDARLEGIGVLRNDHRQTPSKGTDARPQEVIVTTSGPIQNEDSRATVTSKGSIIVFPKVEIKWNAAGEVIQDTFLDLTNDYPNSVRVQMYFVNADCCVWLDNAITLTGDQPIYWSALTGNPRLLSPFTELGPPISICEEPDECPSGQTCPVDPTNPLGRVLRGYVVAWAIDPITGHEISWNHLKGDAVVVNYEEGSAWEYNAWAFKALSGVTGNALLEPFGQLDLNGVEYDWAPDHLVLDFYASGSTFFTGQNAAMTIDTDLTLMAAFKDFTIVAPQGGQP